MECWNGVFLLSWAVHKEFYKIMVDKIIERKIIFGAKTPVEQGFFREIALPHSRKLAFIRGLKSRLQIEEVLEELLAVFGEDGFGMELNAVHRIFGVHKSHDFAFGGFRRDFQTGRQAFAFDD